LKGLFERAAFFRVFVKFKEKNIFDFFVTKIAYICHFRCKRLKRCGQNVLIERKVHFESIVERQPSRKKSADRKVKLIFLKQ